MIVFHSANFEFPLPFRSRVRSRHATDRRTDGRTDTGHHFTMPLPTEVGHNNMELLFNALFQLYNDELSNLFTFHVVPCSHCCVSSIQTHSTSWLDAGVHCRNTLRPSYFTHVILRDLLCRFIHSFIHSLCSCRWTTQQGTSHESVATRNLPQVIQRKLQLFGGQFLQNEWQSKSETVGFWYYWRKELNNRESGLMMTR